MHRKPGPERPPSGLVGALPWRLGQAQWACPLRLGAGRGSQAVERKEESAEVHRERRHAGLHMSSYTWRKPLAGLVAALQGGGLEVPWS